MRLSTTSYCLALALLVGCGDDKGGVTDTTTGTSSTGAADPTGSTGEPTTTTATGAATSDGSLASDVTVADTGAETSGTTSTTASTDVTTTDATGTGSETTSGTSDGTTASTDTTDASSSTGGGGLGEGEICQDDPDGCAPGLKCCYPCGVPDCMNKCIKPDPNTQMCPLFP